MLIVPHSNGEVEVPRIREYNECHDERGRFGPRGTCEPTHDGPFKNLYNILKAHYGQWQRHTGKTGWLEFLASRKADWVPRRLRKVREHNPCHEPDSGKFAPRGTGNCEGAVTGDAERKKAIKLIRAREDFDPQAVAKVLGPMFRAQLQGMLEEAPAAQQHLETNLRKVMEKVNGSVVDYPVITEGTGIRGSVGGIKGVRRIVEKAVLDADGDLRSVKDVVRASVAVDSLDQVAPVLKALKSRFDVIKTKNRFIRPTGEGYRDVLMNFRAPNGMIGEIQVHVKSMLHAKETTGHKLYTQMRRLSGQTGKRVGQIATILSRKSLQLYSAAWASALALTTGVGMHR